MTSYFKENLPFFIPYLLFLIGAGLLIFNIQKLELHTFVNGLNSPFFDDFFKYITLFGTGIFAFLVGSFLLLKKIRYGLFIIVSTLVSGAIAQILKRFVFEDILRPAKVFEGIFPLHFIQGVTMKMHFSFPSGHATSAFTVFLCLAAVTKNSMLKFTFFVIAFLVASSRVYLSQHFLNDIYAGSIIGVITSIVFYKLIYLSRKTWMDETIITVFKK